MKGTLVDPKARLTARRGPQSPAHSAASYRWTPSGFSRRLHLQSRLCRRDHLLPRDALRCAGWALRTGTPRLQPQRDAAPSCGAVGGWRGGGQLQAPGASGWEQSSLRGLSLARPVPRSHRTVFLLCHLRGLICPFLPTRFRHLRSTGPALPLHRWRHMAVNVLSVDLQRPCWGLRASALCPAHCSSLAPPTLSPPFPDLVPSSFFFLCSCFLLRTLLSSLFLPG